MSFMSRFTAGVRREQEYLDSRRVFVCTDCIMAIVNDEWPEDNPELPRLIVKNLEEGHYYAPGDSENDIDFSTAPCDSCRNYLAGSRHEMYSLDYR